MFGQNSVFILILISLGPFFHLERLAEISFASPVLSAFRDSWIAAVRRPSCHICLGTIFAPAYIVCSNLGRASASMEISRPFLTLRMQRSFPLQRVARQRCSPS